MRIFPWTAKNREVGRLHVSAERLFAVCTRQTFDRDFLKLRALDTQGPYFRVYTRVPVAWILLLRVGKQLLIHTCVRMQQVCVDLHIHEINLNRGRTPARTSPRGHMPSERASRVRKFASFL